MLSLRTLPTHLILSSLSPHSTAPVPLLAHSLIWPRMKREGYLSVHSVFFRWDGSSPGFSRKGFYLGCGFLRRCRKGWEGEGNVALEAEILEFMKSSDNPAAFPTKKQLVEAGRTDLVDGILREGGWLASGWDFDQEDYGVEEEKQEAYETGSGRDNDACFGGIKKREGHEGLVSEEAHEEERFEGSIVQLDSQPLASSSGRLLERAAEDDTGIEGILIRLEKEREMNFGVGLKEKAPSIHAPPNDAVVDWASKNSTTGTAALSARNVEAEPLELIDSGVDDLMSKHERRKTSLDVDNVSNSHGPDSWKAWSIQRAGSSNMEFEAGEISYDEIRTGMTNISSNDLKVQERGGGHRDIRSRLRTLEVELSSVLQTLKSQSDENLSKLDHKRSSQELLQFSDDLEFQENDIMSAQDKLRSIRAKLAVLDGKMALAIIEAQKVVEVKQKRIDDAHNALRLLRNVSIVWPNSASEVRLAGSFDGWVTQRKMEKSRMGIFSLNLKLYPGRYEIKFIVDREWKVDPLRPIVHNNGHENNILVIA